MIKMKYMTMIAIYCCQSSVCVSEFKQFVSWLKFHVTHIKTGRKMSVLEKTVKQGEELRKCGCECSAVEGLAHVTKTQSLLFENNYAV